MSKGKKGSFRNTQLLILILIVLVSLLAFVKNRQRFVKVETAFLPGLAESEIDKLVITKAADDQVALIRQGDDWQIESQDSLPVDPDLVDKALETLVGLEKEELVSENQEKHGIYQINLEEATAIEPYRDGNLVAKIYLGKSGPDFQSFYVRLDGEDQVYRVKGYLRTTFLPADWRQLKAVSFDSKNVSSVEFINETDFIISKQEDKWLIDETESVADQAKVDNLLSQLSGLKASDMERMVDQKLDEPVRTITVTTDDGHKTALELFFAEEEDKYWLTVEGLPYLYHFTVTSVEPLLTEMSDFLSE